jgi:hypothetical protein
MDGSAFDRFRAHAGTRAACRRQIELSFGTRAVVGPTAAPLLSCTLLLMLFYPYISIFI